MESNELRYVKSLVSKIDNRSGVEKIRTSLYSILTVILLSNGVFKRNIDIKPFINALNLDYKEYVFKSRTLILARVIRDIENSGHEKLLFYVSVCKQVLFPSLDKKIDAPNRTVGSINDLLNQFKRGN